MDTRGRVDPGWEPVVYIYQIEFFPIVAIQTAQYLLHFTLLYTINSFDKNYQKIPDVFPVTLLQHNRSPYVHRNNEAHPAIQVEW